MASKPVQLMGASSDFGTIAMPLDQALETISTNPYFLQLRQDFD